MSRDPNVAYIHGCNWHMQLGVPECCEKYTSAQFKKLLKFAKEDYEHFDGNCEELQKFVNYMNDYVRKGGALLVMAHSDVIGYDRRIRDCQNKLASARVQKKLTKKREYGESIKAYQQELTALKAGSSEAKRTYKEITRRIQKYPQFITLLQDGLR